MTIKIHAINDPTLDPDQFHVTEEEFLRSLEDDPELREVVEFSQSLGPDGDREKIAEANILIGWSFPAEAVAAAKDLRWIHVIGAGVDHLEPLGWVPEGVTLTNSSGVHAERAGEYVATGLLMFNSLIPMHLEAQGRQSWEPRYSTVIRGKTVVIVGIGAIGGAAAERAKDLGLHVRGVRRSERAHPHVDEMYRTDQLDEALTGADFLVVCAALTPETRGLIGRAQLELLPPHGGVINTSREPLVDYEALADLLREGRLGGALLDVFEPEPLAADSPLWDCPRMIITPHVSSDPLDYTASMLQIFVDNLRQDASGGALRNVIATD